MENVVGGGERTELFRYRQQLMRYGRACSAPKNIWVLVP